VSKFFLWEDYNLEDLEAINRMAMDQISRMDGAVKVEVPPVISQQKSSFWSNDYVSRYRPSENSPALSSYTPRTYYSSLTNYSSGSGSSMDAFYRKMLNAVYKQEKTEPQANNEAIGGQIMAGTYGSLSLCNDDNVVMVSKGEAGKQQSAPRPQISPDARNQVTAILLSGIAKVATTMVLNWARDKRVPYELL
jgi:hypothetical protein